MNKKIRLDIAIFALVAAVIVSILATTFIINQKLRGITEVQAAFAKIKYLEQLVDEHYIGSIDSEELVNDVAKGYVSGLGDTYAAYYTKEEYRAYQAQITGQYDGIGLTAVWKEKEGLEVTYIAKNSPAASSGVAIGDIITFVGDKSVLTLGYDDAVTALVGTAGTVANFTVKRGDQTLEYSVVRSQYEKETVEYALYGSLGYVKLSGFNNQTADAFSAAIDALEQSNVKGYVMDLRNNPGGMIDAMVNCLDRLVGRGVVATAVRKDDGTGSNKTVYEAVTAQEVSVPIAVLVDRNTASLGELFAAVLKDFGKATLIGETTYGKGTGQTTYKLPDGSYLKITDFTYYPPSGNSFHLIGLTPDTRITLTEAQAATRYTMAKNKDPYILEAFTELGGDPASLREDYNTSTGEEGGL